MITLFVAAVEAFATNQSFNPEALYVGTVIVDIAICITINDIMRS